MTFSKSNKSECRGLNDVVEEQAIEVPPLERRPGLICYQALLSELRLRIPLAGGAYPHKGSLQAKLASHGHWLCSVYTFVKVRREVVGNGSSKMP